MFHVIRSYQQYGSDDLAVSQDLSLKHLMFLEKLHLGLQITEVRFTILHHFLHALGHPFFSLTHRQEITFNRQSF